MTESVNNDDERDYVEEDANRAEAEREGRAEIGAERAGETPPYQRIPRGLPDA